MTDKHSLAVDGTDSALSDWPTLIERVVEDVSRIVRSEAHMFQADMGAALELQISKTIARLTNTLMILIGALCMLCALLFLLHQWFPWWQTFGAIGLAMLLVGIVGNAVMKT
jgi:Putative Actinobacterial Holin-X, holin superfamily III